MKNPAGQIGQSHSGHRRGQHGHGVFWRRPGSMQPITSYHVISCWSMLVNVGQCCLYQMCSYLSGQCGENVWGWKLHCILQICLKLGFKNLRRGTEPFPLLLSFEDQLLHLSMTCVQLIDLHCLSQPLLSLSLSEDTRLICQTSPNIALSQERWQHHGTTCILLLWNCLSRWQMWKPNLQIADCVSASAMIKSATYKWLEIEICRIP